MSDSMRPHRWQPTRLPCPWDSPGKNTGVGCHFFLQCMKVKIESEVAQSCPTPSDPMDCSLPGSSVHGIFPGKSTRVGCHCLLRTVILEINISFSQFIWISQKSDKNNYYYWVKLEKSLFVQQTLVLPEANTSTSVLNLTSSHSSQTLV